MSSQSSPSKPLTSRDVNTSSPSKSKSEKPSILSEKAAAKQPKSMEYHRQVLQSKLEEDKYIQYQFKAAEAVALFYMADDVCQVKASLHIAFGHHHEPVHGKAFCVQKQAFHEVSFAVPSLVKLPLYMLRAVSLSRSKPKSLFSKMESSQSASASNARSDEDKDGTTERS